MVTQMRSESSAANQRVFDEIEDKDPFELAFCKIALADFAPLLNGLLRRFFLGGGSGKTSNQHLKPILVHSRLDP